MITKQISISLPTKINPKLPAHIFSKAMLKK